MVIPCSLMSLGISGTREMLDHVLITTLWSFTAAVLTWIMSSRSIGEDSRSRDCTFIQPDLKDFTPDSDVDPQLVGTGI